MAIHLAIGRPADRFTSFFTAQAQKLKKKNVKKCEITDPNGLNQQRQKAGRIQKEGSVADSRLPLLVILCIILIFIYILSILHNARVTTEIVGWQFINT